jgi:hypothetical protein
MNASQVLLRNITTNINHTFTQNTLFEEEGKALFIQPYRAVFAEAKWRLTPLQRFSPMG